MATKPKQGDSAKSGGGKEGTPLKDTVALILGVGAIFLFGYLSYYLFTKIEGTNDTNWNRMIFIYGGIEAVAFAAVGWFFGKEVNRQRAENAETRADDAALTNVGLAGANGQAVGMVDGIESLVRIKRDARVGAGLDEILRRDWPVNVQASIPELSAVLSKGQQVLRTTDPDWDEVLAFVQTQRAKL
jgi:hypothetical protein